MSSVEIKNKLSEIETVGDVADFSGNILLEGEFTDFNKESFWDGKGQEFHIKDGDRIVCRIIELPEDGLTDRKVKNRMKDQGKKDRELFTIVVTSQSSDGSLLERKIDGSIQFMRVERRHSEDSVDVKHDLRYFEVDPRNIEPLYIDYLNNLQINGRSLKQMEKDVSEIFSIKKITKNFYEDFSDIFHEKLKPAVNNLENENKNLTSYTQLLVNRILFLMFVQEKGWLDENKSYIQDKYSEIRNEDDKDAYDDFFKPLFFEALNDTEDSPEHLGRIPYLNGGLFEERPEEEDVEIDEEFFEALLSPEEDEHKRKEGFLLRYKLSLSENNPAEQELVVDPEFIGRIFEMFMVSEERSEKGAFYTPKEITQYMSKNAIKQLLLNELPEKEEGISQLVLNHTTEDLDDSELETIQEELKDINVLDPAVGSGAFIIAVMEELVQIQEAINDQLDKDENRFELKEHMIARNLYGVDIDESGIELCKFRTWLHLIQDLHISLDELLEENDRYALPNLDFKFFVGNSLAGDFKPTEVIEKFKKETASGSKQYQLTLDASHDEDRSVVERLKGLRREYTNTHGSQKKKLENQITRLQEELEESFNWNDNEYYMKEVVKEAGSDFKWSVKMPEIMVAGGFDLVIGNPPYQGSSKQKYANKLSHFYEEKLDFFSTIFGMRYDLYQAFNVRGWELTKTNGVVSYITSDTYLTIGSKESTRKLFQQNKLKEILLANEDTFDAEVKPSIFLLKKGDYGGQNYSFKYIDGREADINSYRSILASSKDHPNIEVFDTKISFPRNTIRKSFFKPTELNLEIHKNLMSDLVDNAEKWREEIADTNTLEENKDRILTEHVSDLENGDPSLLGLLTTGGVGLRTYNNDEHLAYIEGSESAEKVKNRNDNFQYEKQNENGYRWMSRVIKEERTVNPDNLTEKERLEGLEDNREDIWLPIQKGADKDDVYYKETEQYIDWTKDSLRRIKERDGGRLRNTEYFFNEGLFVSRAGTGNPKIRYVDNAVIDDSGVFLLTITDKISAKYLTGLLNSQFIQYFINNFLNHSVNTQIMDIRFVPVIIPSEDQKEEMEQKVEKAISIRKGESDENLEEVQKDIDNLVESIYRVDLDG